MWSRRHLSFIRKKAGLGEEIQWCSDETRRIEEGSPCPARPFGIDLSRPMAYVSM